MVISDNQDKSNGDILDVVIRKDLGGGDISGKNLMM